MAEVAAKNLPLGHVSPDVGLNARNKDAAEEDEEGEHYLQDTWTLYFHEPSNADWTMSSYVRLEQLSSVEGFWQVHEGVRPYLSRGMFFLMREHVFPCWDDPGNIDGGCISIKVLKEDLETFWEEAVSGMLGERLVRYAPPGGGGASGEGADKGHLSTHSTHSNLFPRASEVWSAVNGISTSPKRYFCICKIWLKDGAMLGGLDTSDSIRRKFALPVKFYGEPLYRSNAENIRQNNERGTLPGGQN